MLELFTIDIVKVAVYITLFIPGFVYIQTIEHHLLREKKAQFEKTLEIVLSSTFIWAIALSLPIWWPWADSRERLVNRLSDILIKQQSVGLVSDGLAQLSRDSSNFFFSICLWTFASANIWGMIRENRWVDARIKYVTGRDWFPSVSFKFFQENLNRAIEVKVSNKRYLGVLYIAPDNKDDN